MKLEQKIWDYELNRLSVVMEQISRDIVTSEEKLLEQKETLREINKNMLSEFKFETDSTVDLEGAAVMHHYQTMGLNVENAMNYQKQHSSELAQLIKNTYFAKIVFKEAGDEEEEEIYIGSSSLIKEDSFEYLIYDWRAPISSIFYDYEKGDVTYDAPGGEVKGDLISKRHFKIKNGKIEYMFDSNINIMDEMLKEALAKSVDDKMKTIITTIQKEQNQVIRDESADVLVVSGSAGSGKTSIALHKIAYLLYKNRETILPMDILIFTPNDIFSDYISHVLPELGEQNVDSMTFNDYIETILGIYLPVEQHNHRFEYREKREEGEEIPQSPDPVDSKVLKCYWEEIESYYDQMEYLLSPVHDQAYKARVKSMIEKSTSQFFQAFDDYISDIELKTDFFEDLYYDDTLLLSKEDMYTSYLDCANVIKCSSRLLQVRARLMEKVKEMKRIVAYSYEKQLIEGADYYTKPEIKRKVYKYLKRRFKPLHRKIRNMTSFDLLDLYNKFLKTRGLNILNKKLSFEDALCLMYMKGRLDTIKEVKRVKYLVIDEAQDYTLLHYKIISLIFGHCKYTLLGDPNQAIHPYISSKVTGDVEDFLGVNPKHIRLTKTYRSTKQISDFCGNILPQGIDIENVLRDGDEVLITQCDDDTIVDKLLDDVKDVLNSGLRSVAIIGKTKEHCSSFYKELKQKLSNYDFTVGLINNEEQMYKTGVILIPSYLAKGLEFDSVHVISDETYTYNHERERQLFYTVCTRALHKLNVYYTKEMPELIQEKK